MSATYDELGQQVLGLIRDRLSIDVASADVDLIETGLIDSLALVTLINVLEERFDCELPLDDFDVEDFRSARRISEFLDASGALSAQGDIPAAAPGLAERSKPHSA